jgi:hypothetical protein
MRAFLVGYRVQVLLAGVAVFVVDDGQFGDDKIEIGCRKKSLLYNCYHRKSNLIIVSHRPIDPIQIDKF